MSSFAPCGFYSTATSSMPSDATSGRKVPKLSNGINRFFPSKLWKCASVPASIMTYSLKSAKLK
nr:MAG TPA: hypothetical protein [Myoviridae sp. ctTfa5]